jgi:hypothetical protein
MAFRSFSSELILRRGGYRDAHANGIGLLVVAGALSTQSTLRCSLFEENSK